MLSTRGLHAAAAKGSYWELLNNPEQEQTIFGNRARSATDANVLRRKGERVLPVVLCWPAAQLRPCGSHALPCHACRGARAMAVQHGPADGGAWTLSFSASPITLP